MYIQCLTPNDGSIQFLVNSNKMQLSGLLSACFSFLMIFPACTASPGNDTVHQLYADCRVEKFLSFEVFNMAFTGYNKMEGIRKKNIITIIDYSKSSSEERMFVVDVDKRLLLFHCQVAHGKNSGEDIAVSFSNEPNSLQSSLGFFLTAETYTGENGYSMKLDGLEKGINDNARSREIVIHGADYVSEDFIKKYGRLGRSWGCPALPQTIAKEVIDVISNGSCLFIFGEDIGYIMNPKFYK